MGGVPGTRALKGLRVSWREGRAFFDWQERYNTQAPKAEQGDSGEKGRGQQRMSVLPIVKGHVERHATPNRIGNQPTGNFKGMKSKTDRFENGLSPRSPGCCGFEQRQLTAANFIRWFAKVAARISRWRFLAREGQEQRNSNKPVMSCEEIQGGLKTHKRVLPISQKNHR